MRRVCLAIALTVEALATTRFNHRDVHEVVYLAQRLLNFNLGYRFSWLASGPYSKALATELREHSSTCADSVTTIGSGGVRVAARMLRSLITEAATTAGLPPRKALNIIASYVMLAYDVYPKPADTVAEVLRVRRWACRKVVEGVVAVLSKFLRPSRGVERV